MPNRVVVVTGASSGVGRATVREFARRGADVGLLARGIDGLEAAAKEVEAEGGRAVVLPADVADPEQVESATTEVEANLGPIDVWVNNAMVSVFSPFADMTQEEFRRVIEVNFLGVVHGTRAALRSMLPRDRGVIVQVGSALAYRGIPLQSAYCGAKHAVQGFTESVRCELVHEGSHVRLTMVQLPALNTPHFEVALNRMPNRPQPVPPIYVPELAAEAIAWAAEHPRREVWVGGSTAATLVANAVAPGLLDRYLGRTGYRSQQTDDQSAPGDRFNLWDALPGDRGAVGPFGDRSHVRSVQYRLSTHRGAAAAALAVGALGLLKRLKKSA
jgi:NAD(P)-dependent dehydrogenase (short-subunit alcohol dehydrogenase family)